MITTYVIDQWTTFLIAMADGMLLAVVFDLFRLSRFIYRYRKQKPLGFWQTAIEDVWFAAIVFVNAWLVLYLYCEGRFYNYVFLSIGLGGILYEYGIGRYVMLFLKRGFRHVWQKKENKY